DRAAARFVTRPQALRTILAKESLGILAEQLDLRVLWDVAVLRHQRQGDWPLRAVVRIIRLEQPDILAELLDAVRDAFLPGLDPAEELPTGDDLRRLALEVWGGGPA